VISYLKKSSFDKQYADFYVERNSLFIEFVRIIDEWKKRNKTLKICFDIEKIDKQSFITSTINLQLHVYKTFSTR